MTGASIDQLYVSAYRVPTAEPESDGTLDHVRIERMLFDGFLEPRHGSLHADTARPGFGVTFRQPDASAYQVYASPPGTP